MNKEAKKNLLVIDDDRLFCTSVLEFFKHAPFHTFAVQTGSAGLQWCREHRAEVILLDQKLPDTFGLQLCEAILAVCEQAKIIFITAYPSFDHAVQALRLGAYDYLSKPMELDELQLAVDRAFRTFELEKAEQLQKLHVHREVQQNQLVGKDGGLKDVYKMIELAADTHAPVLITGETGTGKNVVAKSIHYRQNGKISSLIDINCAALPENLIESELFGHERGAFTGAVTTHKGLFEVADGGAVFLDEIGEIPLHLQAKLLGILDNSVLRRLGSQITRRVDVRIIAATNIDLEQAVQHKKFRKDLFYRLSVIRIHLPPLRYRLQDLPELCTFFLKEIMPEQHLILPPEEIDNLCRYPWPGNVRELRNILERAIILRKGRIVRPSQLLTARLQQYCIANVDEHSHAATPTIIPLAEMEKRYIESALTVYANNHTRTAEALGIARSTLLRKIEANCIKTGVSKSITDAK